MRRDLSIRPRGENVCAHLFTFGKLPGQVRRFGWTKLDFICSVIDFIRAMSVEILRTNGRDEIFLADTIAGIRAPAFCDCVFPRSTDVLSFKGNIHDHISCKCGENEGRPLEWIWDKESADPACYVNGRNITFHPTFSQGTTVIRGEKRLEPGMIHFWEMKIVTSLSGTETMVGIGTDKVDLFAHRFRFTSALGLDNQSWGFSFRGKAQYNNRSIFYGKPYSQGCLVGVYLDLSRGYLEFFLNRRSLGIAYKNIPVDPSVKIYPMTCSTAASSAIRLINSTSCPDNLEFRCMRVVAKNPDLLAHLNRMPGLKYLSNRYWYLIPYQGNSKDTREVLSLEDEAILSTRKSKKMKISDDIDDIADIYEDAHTIKHRAYLIDSEDEFDDLLLDPREFFYFFCDH